MDLLDRLLGHDAWTTRELLLRCQNLSDAQLDHEIDLGHKTLRATLLHLIWNMEAWTDGLAGRPLRDKPNDRPEARSVPGMIARLDAAGEDLARVARGVAARNAWDERWKAVDDPAGHELSYGGAIAHVITHSMHHRAQIIAMLRRLGVHDLPEGDVLSWEEQLPGARR
jgi:uncharacterized damage-inducible protein DinB